jgi:hypothetical protein
MCVHLLMPWKEPPHSTRDTVSQNAQGKERLLASSPQDEATESAAISRWLNEKLLL